MMTPLPLIQVGLRPGGNLSPDVDLDSLAMPLHVVRARDVFGHPNAPQGLVQPLHVAREHGMVIRREERVGLLGQNAASAGEHVLEAGVAVEGEPRLGHVLAGPYKVRHVSFIVCYCISRWSSTCKQPLRGRSCRGAWHISNGRSSTSIKAQDPSRRYLEDPKFSTPLDNFVHKERPHR